MATLFRDFSNTAVDSQPANTTLRRSASSGDFVRRDDDNEAVLRYRASSGGIAARGLQYDAVSSSGTVEVFGLARDQDETSPVSLRLVCFASDAPDNEYGAIIDATKNVIQLYKRINGSFSTLSEISKSINSNLYDNIRLQVAPGSPNELKLRVWDEGASEPSTWDVTTTDNELDTTNGGWIGHIGFAESESVLFKKVGIGTNGDAAPTTGATGSTVSGEADQYLSNMVQDAAGTLSFEAGVAQTLASVTQEASGDMLVPVSGSATQTLPMVAQDASGTVGDNRTGAIAQTLPMVAQDAQGAFTYSGVANQNVPALRQSAAGSVTVPTAAQTLPAITQSAVGEFTYSGPINQTLPTIYGAVPRASGRRRFFVTPGELMTP